MSRTILNRMIILNDLHVKIFYLHYSNSCALIFDGCSNCMLIVMEHPLLQKYRSTDDSIRC